ncbi:putative ribonuclease H-like domain-containing protein [Tanacetum coccineum]
MDLKWQMAMLTMRESRFLKKTGRNLGVNGIDTIGFDKTKCDGFGYDWSDHAEEGPTKFALMAYTSSGSSSSSSSDYESQLNVGAHKAGLESVEARLEVYKKNEVVFEEDIKILKLDVMLRDNALTELRKKFKKAENEREDLKLTLEKFETSSKNLSKLLDIQVLDSQVNDKYKIGEGYHAVPPLYIRNFMPPKPDLVLADVDEYGVSESVTSVPAIATSKAKTSKSKPKEFVKKAKNNKQAKYHRKSSQSPRAVLMKSGLKTLNTARQNFSRAVVSVNTARQNSSKAAKPVNIASQNQQNNNINKKVNTVKGNVTTARIKAVVSNHKGNEANAVKASPCWIWRLKQKVLDHGNLQLELQKKGVIDSGCSRHMTGNISYLSDYKEINGGYVAFGGDPKGGKITGKGKIRTGKLDIEYVYFVKELKFNIFSVSQMCYKKNSVLFTDTECIVLSLDFKLSDESHVLLKVPRKDNMYSIDLNNIVPQGENLIDFKVKVIRCDNGTEFKNRVMNLFCEIKGIKREFSVARTPQQNRVAERKNRTLTEAAKTMLADSKLPTTFWAEAVNTACYVQNRVLVIKPHKKTPYELFLGRKPVLSFMRPFGCPVTILNTLDRLGEFDGKADEGFFVGYYTNSKAFMVFNSRTRIVEENMHVKFSEDTPNIAGNGPKWLFDIDALTKSMNYEPIVAGNQSNSNACTKTCDDAGKARVETVPGKNYILLPLWTQVLPFSSSLMVSLDAGFKPSEEEEKKDVEALKNKDNEVPNIGEPRVNQEQDDNVNSINNINTVNLTVNAAGIEDTIIDENIVYGCDDDPNMPELEEIVYSDDHERVGVEADIINLDTHILANPIPITRIHKDHPLKQIIRDIHSAPQTRRMTKSVTDHGLFSSVQQRINHKDFQNCLFACFLSQVEPKKVIQALSDPSWIEAMQEELLQFKLQQVWTLVDLPYGKRAIGTKWVYRNKKDERGIVIRNKARLVAQGYTQEEGNDYDEVFAPVARIEAIRLFLAYASLQEFLVYQMDVNSAFIYGKIEEEVYVCQLSRFEDPEFSDKVYKVEKALYGLHQAPRAWYETLSTYLMDNRFRRGYIDKALFIKRVKGDILLVQMSSMGELTFFLGLQVTQKHDGIFICQDKYVDEILKKFDFSTVKTASTPMEASKPLLNDENDEVVDVYLYRSMIGSLMYLTSSRPDIMFDVCACARFQVTPKVSHLYAVKIIFRYLKVQPKLGLWYHKDSLFDLEAYTNSDYAGASLDRKSIRGGC